ncbi:MAG: DUF6841 family protein [Polymorphobacter sp.]
MSENAALDAEIGAFFVRFVAAWDGFDVEALLDCLGFPHLIASRAGTHFFEDDAEALVNLEALIDKYRAAGVRAVRCLGVTVEALPDDAARACVEWRLDDGAGAQLLHFPTLYTLAKDAEGWHIVAIDAQGEADAWAGAGWA